STDCCSFLSYLWFSFMFFYPDEDSTTIHSFPTRRSSDLGKGRRRPRRSLRTKTVHPGSHAAGGYHLAVHCLRASTGEDNGQQGEDRKSTRLNSSHVSSSYAVFCLKKKTLTHVL